LVSPFQLLFFWRGGHLFSALPSFRLHASDAHHRGPLEPAGVEGHAADDVEIIPGKGKSRTSDLGTPVAANHCTRHGNGERSRRACGAITVVNIESACCEHAVIFAADRDERRGLTWKRSARPGPPRPRRRTPRSRPPVASRAGEATLPPAKAGRSSAPPDRSTRRALGSMASFLA
jgi:hypothetical protein